MTDVFISYKREDRERCAALAEALRQLELAVWFDASIEPGMTFDREIERELKQAKAVLVLWSEKSVDSDWVRNEARVGRAADKLVAVKIEECDLPLEFMASQAAMLPGPEANEDWSRVVGRIGRLADRPGLLPFVEAQAAGRPALWQDWLDRFASDPLAPKARRYLDALGGGSLAAPVPAAPVLAAATPAPPEAAPAEAAAPAGSDRRRLYWLAGAAIAIAALAALLLPWGVEPVGPVGSAPAPSASATLAAAPPSVAQAAPVTAVPATDPAPGPEQAAPVEAAQEPPAQAPAPAATCDTGPYVIAITADSSAMLAAGEATLAAAAQAYQAGCQGRTIRIRGVADRSGGVGDPMQLMRRRTAAVAAYLGNQGLPRDRMETNVVDQARAPGGMQGERIVVTFGN